MFDEDNENLANILGSFDLDSDYWADEEDDETDITAEPGDGEFINTVRVTLANNYGDIINEESIEIIGEAAADAYDAAIDAAQKIADEGTSKPNKLVVLDVATFTEAGLERAKDIYEGWELDSLDADAADIQLLEAIEQAKEIADQQDESACFTNPVQENNTTMIVTKDVTPEVVKVVTPATFNKATLTFNSEAEYHDVVAALAAYANKRTNVSGTGLAEKYKLTSYSGNARRTVNAILANLP